MIKNGVDGTSVEGAADILYGIPNLQVDLHTSENRRARAMVAFGGAFAHRVFRGSVP